MNKSKQKIFAVVAAVVLGVGGLLLLNARQDTSPTVTGSQQEFRQSSLTVSEDGKTVSYDGQTGKTALELLQSLTEVVTEKSDFGDFVAGINGITADGKTEYWSFYVNGGYASEGAGTYKTTDGEKIEWRLEKI